MRALVTSSPGNIEFAEMDVPAVQSGNEVLLRVLAAGICGSDLHIFHGKNPFATYPRIMGHEVVAEVAETGTDVTKVKVGDKVILNQISSCGECYACKIRRPNVCKTLQVIGVHVDGGFREYLTAPEDKLYRLPAGLALTDAVMIEPLSIAVQGCWRGGLTDADTLLILGAGALGSSILKVARTSGARIIVADLFDEKLAIAKASGASEVINTKTQNLEEEIKHLTDGYGPTLSIDAAVFPGSLRLLIQISGNAGRVVTMGFSTEEEAISPFLLTGREIDVRGSRLQSNQFPKVIEMIHDGKLSVEGLVSHVMPFSQGKEAIALADSGRADVRKVVLDMTK